MEIVFEIGVGQQTRTRGRAFEGVMDPKLPLVLAVQSRPYLVNFWSNYDESSKHAQNQYTIALDLIY